MTDHISRLKPDPQNARRHTPRNVGLIADALQEVGAARSVVIDFQATVSFADMADVAAFEALIGQHIPRNTRGVWYPPKTRARFRDYAYAEAE